MDYLVLKYANHIIAERIHEAAAFFQESLFRWENLQVLRVCFKQI